MRKLISIFAVLMLYLPATAQQLYPLSPHPEGVAWPTEGWERGTMPDDAAEVVYRLMDKAMASEKGEPMGETRAIVIIHKGKLIAEAYRDGFTANTKQMSWSMAKSVTSALVGRAVHLGLIDSIDDPMPTPYPEGDPRREITWRQWLNMTEGLNNHELAEVPMHQNLFIQMMFGDGKYDVAQYAVNNIVPESPPGEVWKYSTAGYHMIGWGLNQLGPHYELEHEPILAQFDFLSLIGMSAQPEFDAAGTYLGGSNVWASAHDYAKFGYLYLRDGVWEGERLLPEGWVDFSRTNTPADNNNTYGAGFWVTSYGKEPTTDQAVRSPPWDAFNANGSEGQTIWIVPSRDLVIVRTGQMENTTDNWNLMFERCQEIARAFPEVSVVENAPAEEVIAE